MRLTQPTRERLRDAPESRSTCGPRTAYEAAAAAASASVADAVALGPDDAIEMAGSPPGPGEVFVLLLEGERDDNGTLISVVPEPGAGADAAAAQGPAVRRDRCALRGELAAAHAAAGFQWRQHTERRSCRSERDVPVGGLDPAGQHHEFRAASSRGAGDLTARAVVWSRAGIASDQYGASLCGAPPACKEIIRRHGAAIAQSERQAIATA